MIRQVLVGLPLIAAATGCLHDGLGDESSNADDALGEVEVSNTVEKGAMMVEGLVRSDYLENKIGTTVTRVKVCSELSTAWRKDPGLRIGGRSFGFLYEAGSTPCQKIGANDRWKSSFEGFLKVSTKENSTVATTVNFTADVNDGARMVLKDEANATVICKLDLWGDVPQYDNYHSTDAYETERGCSAQLVPGVYYPVKIETYHQSDATSDNPLFNRAYLSLFYPDLLPGAKVQFYRAK